MRGFLTCEDGTNANVVLEQFSILISSAILLFESALMPVAYLSVRRDYFECAIQATEYIAA